MCSLIPRLYSSSNHFNVTRDTRDEIMVYRTDWAEFGQSKMNTDSLAMSTLLKVQRVEPCHAHKACNLSKQTLIRHSRAKYFDCQLSMLGDPLIVADSKAMRSSTVWVWRLYNTCLREAARLCPTDHQISSHISFTCLIVSFKVSLCQQIVRQYIVD